MAADIERAIRAALQHGSPTSKGINALGVMEDLNNQARQGRWYDETLEPTGPTVAVLPTDVEIPATSAEDPLKVLADQFKAERPTPDRVTDYWEARWRILAPKAELEVAQIEMVRCDRTQKEIDKLLREGKGLAIQPKGITRVHLGMMHPEIQSWVVQPGNTLTNEEPSLEAVWFDFEDTTDAPYLGTTEEQLRQAIAHQGRYGMDGDEYIIASQDHRDRIGTDFDTGVTWSRLLRSRNGGRVVFGDFLSDGRLRVYSGLHRLFHSSSFGGRSVGVKKA